MVVVYKGKVVHLRQKGTRVGVEVKVGEKWHKCALFTACDRRERSMEKMTQIFPHLWEKAKEEEKPIGNGEMVTPSRNFQNLTHACLLLCPHLRRF